MKYYQGEDIFFKVPFLSSFQSVSGFSEFSEIRAYAYTDGCLYQKFSTNVTKGYDLITLSNNEISGVITAKNSAFFSPGAITIKIVGQKSTISSFYDIGIKIIGFLHRSLIKIEVFKLPNNYIKLSIDSSISSTKTFSFAAPANVTYVDWGDGNIDEMSPAAGSLVSHTFSENNVFDVKIYTDSSEILSGKFLGNYIPVSDSRKMLKSFDFTHSNISGFGDKSSIQSYGCFASCSNLTSVTFTNKITIIGANTFDGCTLINTFNGDLSNVTGLYYRAFNSAFASGSHIALNFSNSTLDFQYSQIFWNSKVGNITINPIAVAANNYTLPMGMFESCKEMTDLHLGKIDIVGDYALFETFAITHSGWDVDLTNIKKIGDRGLSGAFATGSNIELNLTNQSILFTGSLQFQNCKASKIVIKIGLHDVGGSMFSSCSELTYLDIGNPYTIGDQAFYNCSKMTTFLVGEDLGGGIRYLSNCLSIGNQTFSGLFSMTSQITLKFNPGVTFGSNVFQYSGIYGIESGITTVTSSMFNGCTNLHNVKTGAVTLINDYGFYKCSAITTFNVDLSQCITIGSNAFSTAFSDTFNTLLNFSNSGVAFESSAFQYSKVKQIVIASAAQANVPTTMCGSCSQLTSIEFGSPLAIASYALYQCTALSIIKIHSTVPPTLDSTAITNTAALQTIYVPIGSKTAYQNATNWNQFAAKFVEY